MFKASNIYALDQFLYLKCKEYAAFNHSIYCLCVLIRLKFVFCKLGPAARSVHCTWYPLPWASGLPVAIQCAWNLDPSVHWNATREKKVASVLPVVYQWSSSGFPVVFQCVPIMQINTGLPLEHHWVLASASVVPVAFQCTCGSSGLPVRSVQWYPSVAKESGLEVVRSGHVPACDPWCTQLVWWELFELNWFNLTCNPKYIKPILVLISKPCTEQCWSTHIC